jgi:hypothetical protein
MALETSRRLVQLEKVMEFAYQRQQLSSQTDTTLPAAAVEVNPMKRFATTMLITTLTCIFCVFLYFDDLTQNKLICIVFGMMLGGMLTVSLMVDADILDLSQLPLPGMQQEQATPTGGHNTSSELSAADISEVPVHVSRWMESKDSRASLSSSTIEFGGADLSRIPQAAPQPDAYSPIFERTRDFKQTPQTRDGGDDEVEVLFQDSKQSFDTQEEQQPEPEPESEQETKEHGKTAPAESAVMTACRHFDNSREKDQTPNFDHAEHIRLLKAVVAEHKGADDVHEALWRIARLHYIGAMNGVTGKDEQKRLLEAAYPFAKQALAHRKNADTHKWIAIIASGIGEVSGVKKKLANGHVFHEHTLLALEFEPDNYELNHMMGRFCFEIAKLNWVKKRAVAAIFGELPDVDMPKSEAYFRKADAARKDWMLNLLYLGKTLAEQSKYEEARTVYSKIGTLEAKSNEDKVAQGKAAKYVSSM